MGVDLLAVLEPNVVLRSDRGAGVLEILGAQKVAQRALAFATLIATYRRVLVNGVDGLVAIGPRGDLVSVLAFMVVDGKITEFYVLAGQARLGGLALAELVGITPQLRKRTA